MNKSLLSIVLLSALLSGCGGETEEPDRPQVNCHATPKARI
jgi:outer membrane PBP1 activator LpoA protein